MTNKINELSYKDIKITNHAKQRAFERLKLKKENDLKKIARSAKINGIKISLLNKNNYNNYNLSNEIYEKIKRVGASNRCHGSFYYYKNFMFLFSGKKDRTLITIINLK